MKHSLMCFLFVAVFFSTCPQISLANDWGTKMSLTVRTAHHGNIADKFNDSLVIQPRVIVSTPYNIFCGDISFDFWKSYSPKGGISNDFGDEDNYALVCTDEYDWFGGVSVVYVAKYINLYELDDFGNGSDPVGDVFQALIAVSKTFEFGRHSFSPFMKYEYSWTDKQHQTSGGTLRLGFEHSVQLGRSRLWGNYEVAYDEGVFNYQKGLFGHLDTGLVWDLGRGWSLTFPLLRISSGFTTHDGRKFLVTPGISLSR